MAEVISPNLQDAAIAFGEDTTRPSNLPGERKSGDVLIYKVTLDVTTPLGTPVNVPGAVLLGEPVEQVEGPAVFEVSLWHQVEEGDPAPTVTYDGVERFCIVAVGLMRHARHDPPAPELISLEASTESTTVVRGPSLDVPTADSTVLMIGSAIGEAADYESPPAGMYYELDVNGIMLAAEDGVPIGPTGDRDATLKVPEWNIGGLLVFEPKPIPVNVDPPVIVGDTDVGATVEATEGTWTNEPTGYTYQWELSCRGGEWIYIPDETDATMEIRSAFRGRSVRCLVTAANEGGSEVEPTAGVAVPGAGVLIKRFARNVGGTTVIPAFNSVQPVTLFEPATLEDYFIEQGVDGAITEVPDPAGGDETVLKFVVANEDVFPETPTEDPRAQLDSPFMIPDGAVWEMEGAFWLPDDWPDEIPPGAWVQIDQYFGAPYEGSPPWGLKFAGDEFGFQRNATYGFDKPWGTRKWKKEHWTPTKLRGLQSRNGWVEMWIDGEQITFFDPDEDKFSTYNPNDEPMGTRLYMETIDDSNFEEPNLAVIQHYRALDSFESLTMYHKHLIVRAY